MLRIAAVIVAGLLAGLAALWMFSSEREVSAGRVELSVSPFHRGALDVYVPVVDWGVRFPGVRLPVRLHAEVRAIDRAAAASLASGDPAVVDAVRAEARDAIASYLTSLAAVVAGAALLGGALMVLMLRAPPRHALFGLVPAVAWVGAIAFLLAPRGTFDDAEYYAQGADIPVALRAVQKATRSAANLGEVVDEQLVGLARLVAPGERETLRGLPRLVVASDLHNNILTIEALQRAAGDAPVLFTGDLSDSGTPVEVAVLRQVTRTGRPFVFIGGNHDSDAQMLALARQGAIVLTERGRLMPDGSLGPVVTRVAGLRMAGYTSPNLRRAADGYRDRGGRWNLVEQARFQRWLLRLAGRVDVVLVHEPQLAAPSLAAWRARHPDEPLLVAAGHTHAQAVVAKGSVVLVNGGTIGAGGTGNLRQDQDIGLAVLTVQRDPFRALAADLVQIDPGDGSSTARRERLPAPWSTEELETGAGANPEAGVPPERE